MNDSQPGFVVLEGLDGTGTTTVAGLLAEALQARDLRVRLTAEPTDGPYGRLLRRHLRHEVTLDPRTAALVFTADRADHLAMTIRPALARGRWVICDRYLLSTLAYQGAEGVPRETVMAASKDFDVPDVTFLLDVPDEVRQARMADRGSTERYEDPSLSDGLRKAYADAVTTLRAAGHRIEVLDASVSAAEVAAAALERLG